MTIRPRTQLASGLNGTPVGVAKYYEQIAEEWRGPHERTEEEARERYPGLLGDWR